MLMETTSLATPCDPHLYASLPARTDQSVDQYLVVPVQHESSPYTFIRASIDHGATSHPPHGFVRVRR